MRQRGRILPGARHHGGQGDRPICANLNRCGCNWIANPASPYGLCFSCIDPDPPADGDTVGLAQYWIAETAKRRLIFGLDELQLPVKVSDGFEWSWVRSALQ